jgi:glycosyltransferase involved in cell wall biosynthesis
VLIADGMSDDGTRETLDGLAARNPTLRVVPNPGRIVSSGLNAAIRASTGDVIVRMDAHTTYAPDYVRACVEALDRTGADNVGGPWRAAGETYLQKAIALVSHSRFASGGGRSHALDYEARSTPSTSAAGARRSSSAWGCSTRSSCATRTTS